MTNTIESPEVVVSLTNAEALILFDLLSRFSAIGKLTIEHQAERQVLWDLCCLLEKSLAEPLGENYEQLLQAARESLLP